MVGCVISSGFVASEDAVKWSLLIYLEGRRGAPVWCVKRLRVAVLMAEWRRRCLRGSLREGSQDAALA